MQSIGQTEFIAKNAVWGSEITTGSTVKRWAKVSAPAGENMRLHAPQSTPESDPLGLF